jgi:hypothetical protein
MTEPLRKAETRYVETALDDETIVMDIDSADFFSLNATAGAVWRLIDGTRDRDAIVAALAAEFAASPAEIGADVDALIGQLRTAGFLVGSA